MPSVAKEKMKNKANFKLGKIDVSSLMTSEYDRILSDLVHFRG